MSPPGDAPDPLPDDAAPSSDVDDGPDAGDGDAGVQGDGRG